MHLRTVINQLIHDAAASTVQIRMDIHIRLFEVSLHEEFVLLGITATQAEVALPPRPQP